MNMNIKRFTQNGTRRHVKVLDSINWMNVNGQTVPRAEGETELNTQTDEIHVKVLHNPARSRSGSLSIRGKKQKRI